MQDFTDSFPNHLMASATLRGSEYAWPLDDIPSVIDAARSAGLISVGGQLQFRLAGGGTCECYEIQVDTSEFLHKWPTSKHVELSAIEARRQFDDLPNQFNFVAQGKLGFGKHFDEVGATEADLKAAMCFVWYVTNVASANS